MDNYNYDAITPPKANKSSEAGEGRVNVLIYRLPVQIRETSMGFWPSSRTSRVVLRMLPITSEKIVIFLGSSCEDHTQVGVMPIAGYKPNMSL